MQQYLLGAYIAVLIILLLLIQGCDITTSNYNTAATPANATTTNITILIIR